MICFRTPTGNLLSDCSRQLHVPLTLALPRSLCFCPEGWVRRSSLGNSCCSRISPSFPISSKLPIKETILCLGSFLLPREQMAFALPALVMYPVHPLSQAMWPHSGEGEGSSDIIQAARWRAALVEHTFPICLGWATMGNRGSFKGLEKRVRGDLKMGTEEKLAMNLAL